MTHQQRLDGHRAQIETWLNECFQEREPRGDLYDAMYYSLLAGGKRIRPVLVLETCRMCGGDPAAALPFAGAVEMIHTYSLIHDDLPCMDDDDLRRGRPTNHKVYGEATAVLAGDGLLTAAFETMLELPPELPPERALAAAGLLARAAGGTQEQRQAVRHYAERLGLAFQVRDDILDVVGDEATLGKPIGSDARSEKTTFVTLKGLDACRTLVKRLTGEAIEALAPFGGEGGALCWLAEQLAGREK